ncbi:Crp/Fnr family transcriptional regulator [Hymenobacter rubripertinctus]|nr:Crp/Fnr family transcriptional regulator [Hymenobacter rubripertinctus]
MLPNPAGRLLELVRAVPGLSAAEAAAFVARWQPVPPLRRGDFLIRPGQVEQRLYFVGQGVLRICYPTEAEDICVGFGYEATLLCSFPSFISQQPSEYAIQALRRSELLSIGRAEFMGSLDQIPALAHFWRAELERNLLGRIEREIDLLLPEPARRYARLLARSPQLFQRVPHKYIASYLRMTPETLSRLR